MHFGERADMIALAEQRVEHVGKRYPKAMLLDPKDVNAVYLVALDPFLYSEFPVAGAGRGGMTRSAALRKMSGPLARLMKG